VANPGPSPCQGKEFLDLTGRPTRAAGHDLQGHQAVGAQMARLEYLGGAALTDPVDQLVARYALSQQTVQRFAKAPGLVVGYQAPQPQALQQSVGPHRVTRSGGGELQFPLVHQQVAHQPFAQPLLLQRSPGATRAAGLVGVGLVHGGKYTPMPSPPRMGGEPCRLSQGG